MSISFNTIPEALRVPGGYIEFDNSRANTGGAFIPQVLVPVFRTVGEGTATIAEPTRITSAESAAINYGAKSQAHTFAQWLFKSTTFAEVWFIDAAASGTATTQILTFAGATADADGYLTVKTNLGESINIAVNSGDSRTAVLTKVADWLTNHEWLPLTATVNGSALEIAATWSGHSALDLVVEIEGYEGANISTDHLGLNITAATQALPASAANNENALRDEIIIQLSSDRWYNYVLYPQAHELDDISPLSDTLDVNWGGMVQKGTRVFSIGKYSDAEPWVQNSNNSPHLVGLNVPTDKGGTAAFLWAAALITAVNSLATDPARPCQTLELVGIEAPKVNPEPSERNLMLFNGWATYEVTRSGDVQIERLVTTYQTNTADLPDNSYLDVNTPETLERIRFEQRVRISSRYPRHKLADDGANIPSGQAIVTPQVIKGCLLSLYQELEGRGWVEGFDAYNESLLVERHETDRNRLNFQDNPNLVNQLRVFAGKTQFVL